MFGRLIVEPLAELAVRAATALIATEARAKVLRLPAALALRLGGRRADEPLQVFRTTADERALLLLSARKHRVGTAKIGERIARCPGNARSCAAGTGTARAASEARLLPTRHTAALRLAKHAAGRRSAAGRLPRADLLRTGFANDENKQAQRRK